MAGVVFRREFGDLVEELLGDSELDEDSDQEIAEMDTERYNNNDEDLSGYVRDFKTKVLSGKKIETTYIRSDTNKKFRFPRLDLEDSESSIQSLEGVRFYRLQDQNEKCPYTDSDKLAVIIRKAGKLMQHQLSHHLR